uniref:Zn(2)-C6 fungal-type domain-containing protein n=1 Tax=Bionectria ochroleuca TaxID=29856 RepID=A0A8H7N2H3_BIOOC
MDSTSPVAGASGTGGAARRLQFRRMTHHRKRAVTACEPCRARKAKCTNERPVCQPCVKLGTQCSYEQRANHSSFDPASLLIIEKLNQVLSRLDNNEDEPPIPSASATCEPQQGPDVQPGIEEKTYFCSSFTSTECVMSWPIFEGELDQVNLNEETFLTDYEKTRAFDKEYSEGTRAHRASICEDDIPKYIDRFLHFVHCKNPILHTGTLKQFATSVVENGPGWDAVSCLVLIACALGAIAAPFENAGAESLSPPNDISSLSDNTAARIIAENFYQLACRRLGLLNRSIIACQCQLLCGSTKCTQCAPSMGGTAFLVHLPSVLCT